ncbi:MAG: xanthine dehydrogenase accessory protein XdhC [Alphaproteobacteria bacterium]
MTTLALFERLLDRLATDNIVALVTIHAARGSTPQGEGASMMITEEGAISGTIGGGALEYAIINEAVHLMKSGTTGIIKKHYPLGPDLGQCCGGSVEIELGIFDQSMRADIQMKRDAIRHDASTPLYLFGAGHVGRALVMALAPLPFTVTWIDERAEIFPDHIPRNVNAKRVDNPLDEIGNIPHQGFCLVMTHSHPLDLALVGAALQRNDLAYIGLIGSATKRARFESRLRQSGQGAAALKRMICPVGLPELYGKEPAVIAASIAGDLLIRRQALLNAHEAGPVDVKERLAS